MSRLKFFVNGILMILLLCMAAPASAQEPVPPTPAEIITAVNNLRLSYGLPALNAHPVLMQVAQEQASGIAAGLPGHWRPNGMSLGQWLLSMGYPLSGDLTQDGYRSENWGMALTAEDAVQMWLGDDLHTNTMLSTDRSDIGAGIAVADGQIFVVIETALQTRNGQMQSNVPGILTGIPQTKAAYSQIETQAAINGALPQYSIPVALNTPFPNGRVYHEVMYGQTLWSIAVAYNTTIKQIQSLNNLGDSTTVYEGQTLLVRMDATQSVSLGVSSTALPPPPALMVASPTQSLSTPITSPSPGFEQQPGSKFGVIAIIATALFLAGLFAFMARKPQE